LKRETGFSDVIVASGESNVTVASTPSISFKAFSTLVLQPLQDIPEIV
jgi:hypothetical protein